MPQVRHINLLLLLVGLGACGMLVALSVDGGKSRAGPKAGSEQYDLSAVAEQMLRALAEVDYGAFVAPTGGNLKKLPEDAFLRLVLQHGARLREGFELQRIDSNVRREIEMTRWRLVFAGGGREATLTLGVSRGTVRLFTLW